jgi:hypothetical protein
VSTWAGNYISNNKKGISHSKLGPRAKSVSSLCIFIQKAKRDLLFLFLFLLFSFRFFIITNNFCFAFWSHPRCGVLQLDVRVKDFAASDKLGLLVLRAAIVSLP